MISASAPISSPPDNTMFQRMDNPTVPVKPQNASSSKKPKSLNHFGRRFQGISRLKFSEVTN